MAQPGNYTPIILYHSSTANNVPATANLAAGELAINIPDGKLYYNNSGTITLLASASATNTTIAAGTGISISGSTTQTINAVGAGYGSQSSDYTLVATDTGKFISTTANVTVPASTFSAGNIVTIYNNSGSNVNINNASGVTLQWAGQANATAGSRVLQFYGIATIAWTSANNAVISGAGLA